MVSLGGGGSCVPRCRVAVKCGKGRQLPRAGGSVLHQPTARGVAPPVPVAQGSFCCMALTG